MRLYDYAKGLEQIYEDLADAESPEAQDVIFAALQKVELGFNEKLYSCCSYLKNLDAELEATANAVKTMQAKKKALENRYETFKKYLADNAPKGKWKSEDGMHSIGWRESTSVEILDESLVPIQYKREVYKMEVDKPTAKPDLENGATIPGLELVKKNNIQVK